MLLCIWLRGPQTLCFIYGNIEPNSIVHGDDPVRGDILVLVAGTLICSKDLEMPSFDLVDCSDVRTIAVCDWHTRDHQIKQRSSFRTIVGMLGHRFLRSEDEGSKSPFLAGTKVAIHVPHGGGANR